MPLRTGGVAHRAVTASAHGASPAAGAAPHAGPRAVRLAAAPPRVRRRASRLPVARTLLALLALILALALAGRLAGPAHRSDRLAPFRWQPVAVGVG